MIKFLKRLIKKIFNIIGLDIIRVSKSPHVTMLGLINLPIKTIIDVGANTGQFAKKISNIFPNAHIYSFEPLPEAFEQLKKWAEHQNGRVTVFNTALGKNKGEEKIFCHLDHTPSSSFLKTTEICKNFYPFTKHQATKVVKMKTLDKTIANLGKPLVPDILIKLDVQGYEDRVIHGGVKTFKKAKACIIEVNLDKLYEGQPDFKNILLLLDRFGYRYVGNLEQFYSDKGHVIYINAVFFKYLK